MKFKFELYHYQNDILNTFEKELKRGDKKIHIVAPPGSGKTIMGLEMLSRIDGNYLILVPNITLQYQWKDKLEKMFLEEGEDIENIVSINTNQIKKVNIITYQSFTQTSRENDLIYEQILDFWYLDIKNDFEDKEDFLDYVESLKDLEPETFEDNINKYKKKLKLSGEIDLDNFLSENVLSYLEKLKNNNIQAIIVDEAHHLTNWWSKSIFYIWNEIGKNRLGDVVSLDNSEFYNYPFIIGLTATPPYENSDFFILDDDYSKLLGEVDYYLPTPAVIKSGRLAPYSDLLYFVEPDNSFKKELDRLDNILNLFLEENKDKISLFIYDYIKKNYDYLIYKSHKLLINYLKFLINYSNHDISDFYFDEKIDDELKLDDIAKTIGKYTNSLSLKFEEKNKIESIKYMFYELGYIWRGNNFYRFRTKLENLLIYGQSKIKGIKNILDKEIFNLKDDLRSCIITDLLEEKEGMINCKYIIKNLLEYKNLNPILVSGQGIWKLGKDGELEELETNILEITKDFQEGKTKLLIGTKGILGEGWDAPKLNTLIDLTGIVSYMGVNQVRGRAIRLDKDNEKKVANIYDIVTIYNSYSKDVDLLRLKRKHEQFYGVDDTGIIIKGVNHIYPNIIKHYSDYKNINENMLKRSELREYYYDLWRIGGNYENKELFGLDLEINSIGKIFPFINYKIYDSFSFFSLVNKQEKLENINSNYYYNEIVKRFIDSFIKNIVNTQIKLNELPKDFKYNVIKGKTGNYKLISNYKDDLVVKKFMLDISYVFKKIGIHRYVLKYPVAFYDGNKMNEYYLHFGLPDSLSKNNKSRKIFKKELENDFLKSGFLLNFGKIIDTSIKTPFAGIGYGGVIFLGGINPQISLFSFFIIVYLYLFQNIFYAKKTKIISKYKKLFKKFLKFHWSFGFKFIYLNSKKTKKDDFIGKKPFIESKVEKIWI